MNSQSSIQSRLTKYKNKLLQRQTFAEVAFQQILVHLKIRYVPQKVVFANGIKRIFDFYLPGKKIAFEIDGPYHDPLKDARKDAFFLASRKNWKIVRFTNQDVIQNPTEIAERITSLVARGKSG